MSLLTASIPNMINGVSQQPPAMRLPSQCQEQINGLSSVVEGLMKRPPSKHKARFTDTALGSAFVHMINRDSAERYLTVISDGSIRVFTLDGVEVPVEFPQGNGYLASENPEVDFSAVTIADYTIILNKTKVVEQAPELTPTRPREALVWVKQGAYSANYNIAINGDAFTYTTHSAENEWSGAYIATDFIAGNLFNLIEAASPLPEGSTMEKIGGSVLHFTFPEDVSMSVWDSQGDNNMKLIYGSVQRFSDLPARALGGYQCRVRSQAESDFHDYYVEYETDGTNPYGGVWKESVKGGEPYAFYGHTMPHALIRQANGTFRFEPLNWDARQVGDIDTVPMPSFVGRTIRDVFFHRNRLGFLSDENVIFSRAGEFFNFFRSSALQTLDTDPIDIAVSHVKVSILEHAIPFDETLCLFSGQTQFMLGKTDLLTPKTVSINQTTEFECSLRAKPVGLGSNIYFTAPRGANTSIREYYVDEVSLQKDAADITAHVPKFVAAKVHKLAGSPTEDTLVALSKDAPSSIYVYRYYWSGDEKLQSSWSRWDFPTSTTVLSCDFIESDLWLVLSRPDGCYIEVISLAPGEMDSPSPISVRLDRRITQASVYDLTHTPELERSTFTMPWAPQPGETYKLCAWYGDDTQDYVPGEEVPHTIVGRTVYVPGRLTKFFWGVQYAFHYRMSPLLIREQTAGGGQQPVKSARVQVQAIRFSYDAVGYFRVNVYHTGRPVRSYECNGTQMGSHDDLLGTLAVHTGDFRVPLGGKNDQMVIDIVNDSALPCSLLSAEWSAAVTFRSRRI